MWVTDAHARMNDDVSWQLWGESVIARGESRESRTCIGRGRCSCTSCLPGA